MCETQHPKSEYTFVSKAIQWMHEEKIKKRRDAFHYEETPKVLILLWGVS